MCKSNEVRILLDLDEVLCDFIGGAVSLWDRSIQDVQAHWTLGDWNVLPALGLSLGYPLSTEEFWKRIDQHGSYFWHSLTPHRWVNPLIKLVESLTKDWHVVSSPSWSVDSYVGKVQWLKTQFGRSFTRFAITPHKEIFANPKTILIDDRDKNVQDFRKAGGWGIVFPAYNNSLHTLRDDPLRYVSQALTATVADLTDAGSLYRGISQRRMV